ncbi:hypothetical protein BJ138DRAFT_1120527 [Hygrophoropsis aurantiaca]|uniref:Uncharacterized protein n=1 Tax=Hygrophoropsis aurantiaca TaxID=72124 RepID=A0ACB7ZR25_9AGAM|nr:hypothetical protein BJ138DRAFT_1120527 [Hygrophoropsis aurantiaca]
MPTHPDSSDAAIIQKLANAVSGWRFPNYSAITFVKAFLARSFGYSRKFNERNIEFFWYPIFNHALVDLVSGLPNFVVAPQFPAHVTAEWLDEHGYNDDDDEPQVEEAEDGDDFNVIDIADASGSVPRFLRILPRNLLADLSISSTTTTPGHDVDGVVTDFAVIYLGGRIRKYSKRYGHFDIEEGDAAIRALTRAIEKAKNQALIQAAYFFVKFPKTKQITAIAAVSLYWTSAKLTEDHVATHMELIKGRTPPAVEDQQAPWLEVVPLDYASSRNRLKTIHNELAALVKTG